MECGALSFAIALFAIYCLSVLGFGIASALQSILLWQLSLIRG